MLPRQLLVGVFLDEDRLLQVVHDLQHQDQFLLAGYPDALQIASDDLASTHFQLIHLELPVLVHGLPDQKHTRTHSFKLLIDCRPELPEGFLGVSLLLERVRKTIQFFLDVLEEVVRDVDAPVLINP